MILGAILAGGSARRFGSDKALATIDGKTLLERACDSLRRWSQEIVIVGRDDGPVRCVPDWPRAGLGPVAGIAGALIAAEKGGYEIVLTCGVDSLDLPANLPELLGNAPAYVESQRVIGLWPVSALQHARAILAGEGPHSMRAFVSAIGARSVHLPVQPRNINAPEDLIAARKGDISRQ